MSLYLTFGHIVCPLEVGFITQTESKTSPRLINSHYFSLQ
jgi:hypothetical protein